jgi:ElaB/YqjD/DUF883 family membrane-anchored ribosome-binding protein
MRKKTLRSNVSKVFTDKTQIIDKAKKSVQAVDKFIRKHPYKALGIAVAAALAVESFLATAKNTKPEKQLAR